MSYFNKDWARKNYYTKHPVIDFIDFILSLILLGIALPFLFLGCVFLKGSETIYPDSRK